MTRDEFERDLFEAVRLDCMSQGRAEIIRDQVRALLAAARAEAMEEAAQPMEDDGMARHEDDEVRRVLAHHVRRIRALVKP